MPDPAATLALEDKSNREQNRMTTREQNDFLTQAGPGTPMGNLFRRYWIPALMSKELPEPDCSGSDGMSMHWPVTSYFQP